MSITASATAYSQAVVNAFNKNIDWIEGTIKVMLCSNEYNPDLKNHGFKSDINGEVKGDGYDSGGQIIENTTISHDIDQVYFKGDNINWSNSTITARYAIIYDDSPETEEEKPLIGLIDFGEDQISNHGDFNIIWHENGIMNFTLN